MFSKKNQNLDFFKKHPKLFCLLLTNQISLRGRFVFKTNGRISSITSYINHCCSFFYELSNKGTKKLYFENFEKTPNFGRTVRTLDFAKKLKLEFLTLHQLRLDSRTWKCMNFCFSLSVAASNFQSKSDICQTFSPSWSW